MAREDVVLALDSIQEPVSLFEPVFHDDGDAVYVMDQVQDTKNTDERWIGEYLPVRSHEQIGPERETSCRCVFRGKDTDGGGGRDIHQPGRCPD